MTSRMILLGWLMVAGFAASAQTLPDTISRDLIGSMGGFAETPEMSLQYSVGEPMVTTMIGNGGNLVYTQGFQQENIYAVNIDDGILAMMDIDYWPNPASSFLNLKVSSDILVTLKIQIYDALGRPVALPVQEHRIQAPVETSFDLSRLSEGNYFLMFKNQDNRIVYSLKFQKVN